HSVCKSCLFMRGNRAGAKGRVHYPGKSLDVLMVRMNSRMKEQSAVLALFSFVEPFILFSILVIIRYDKHIVFLYQILRFIKYTFPFTIRVGDKVVQFIFCLIDLIVGSLLQCFV